MNIDHYLNFVKNSALFLLVASKCTLEMPFNHLFSNKNSIYQLMNRVKFIFILVKHKKRKRKSRLF